MMLGRYLCQELVSSLIQKHRIMIAVDKVLKKKGAKITALLRLTPLVPYNVMNYILGATHVRLIDFLIGNCGEIPEVFALLYFGTALR